MSLVFCDSFDHYNVQDQKWLTGSAQATIDLTGTKGRTGIGCLIINSGFQGPLRNLPNLAHFIYGHAVYPTALGGDIVTFGCAAASPNFYFANVNLNIHTDGAIRVKGTGGAVIGSSAAGVIPAVNAYYYIEAEITISDTVGAVKVWVNNVLVVNLTNVDTHDPNNPVYCDQMRLLGLGGGAAYRHDDLYILDPSTPPNDSRLGPIKIYLNLPNADSTPLQWTPNAGVTHYTQVDEVPPDLGTTYVQDGVVGEVDQYLYDTSAIPVGGAVPALQHTLTSALDAAGSGSVGSSVNGVTTGSLALSTSYLMMVQQYDQDPADSSAWTLAKVTAAKIGPVVTA